VHTSTKARLTRVAIRIRDPERQQNLIICSLPIANVPWKFYANPFGSFCTKLLTGNQTNRQTNNDDYITFLTEVNNMWCYAMKCRIICDQNVPCRSYRLFTCALYGIWQQYSTDISAQLYIKWLELLRLGLHLLKDQYPNSLNLSQHCTVWGKYPEIVKYTA